MEWVRPGVALVAGAIMGAWIAVRMRRGDHRRPEDSDNHPGAILLVPSVAFACGWLVWRLASEPWPVLLLWLPLVPLLAGLAATDLDVRRLPNRVFLLAAAWTAVCVGVLAWQQQSLASLVAPGIAAAFTAATFWALHLASRGALAFGDVKLAAVVSAAVAAVAWQSVVWALLGECALALVWAAVTRRREIPFGPWLALGAIIAVGLPR